MVSVSAECVSIFAGVHAAASAVAPPSALAPPVVDAELEELPFLPPQPAATRTRMETRARVVRRIEFRGKVAGSGAGGSYAKSDSAGAGPRSGPERRHRVADPAQLGEHRVGGFLHHVVRYESAVLVEELGDERDRDVLEEREHLQRRHHLLD